MFAINPLTLTDYFNTFGITDPNQYDKWNEFINKCNCKKARYFIPIKWSGANNV